MTLMGRFSRNSFILETFCKSSSNFMIIRQAVDTRSLSDGCGFHIQRCFLHLHTKFLTTQKSIILVFTALQITNLLYEHLCFCKVAQFYCVGRNNGSCCNKHLSVIVVPFCACRWNVEQCTACCGWSSTENTWSLQSIIQHPQYSVGRVGKGNNGTQKYISVHTHTWHVLDKPLYPVILISANFTWWIMFSLHCVSCVKSEFFGVVYLTCK